MDLLYMTTCTSAFIKPPLFYNRPETGNIFYADGTTLQDYLNPPQSSIQDNILSTSDNQPIVTNDNKKILINI